MCVQRRECRRQARRWRIDPSQAFSERCNDHRRKDRRSWRRDNHLCGKNRSLLLLLLIQTRMNTTYLSVSLYVVWKWKFHSDRSSKKKKKNWIFGKELKERKDKWHWDCVCPSDQTHSPLFALFFASDFPDLNFLRNSLFCPYTEEFISPVGQVSSFLILKGPTHCVLLDRRPVWLPNY